MESIKLSQVPEILSLILGIYFPFVIAAKTLKQFKKLLLNVIYLSPKNVNCKFRNRNAKQKGHRFANVIKESASKMHKARN